MRKSFAISAATALILLLLLASFAASLDNPFFVYGDVHNSTGVLVPAGVPVTVRDVTAGGEVIAHTDADGHYQIDVSPIPDSADGNSFTCSASYADETGSCFFTLNLTKPSQPCDIGLSTQIAIEAAGGGDLPTSIPVDVTFTVLITENGSPVGAGTNVAFRLPYDTGSPVDCSTDDDGKVAYKPPITGTLGIRVLDGLDTVAEATVEVITAAAVDTEPPVAVAEPSHQTVNVSETAYFDGSGSSDNVGIVSYEWDFGDGTDPATGETTSHTYPMVGLYTVTLTVCDAAGNKDTDVADVTVDAPEVIKTLSNDTNFTLEFNNANVTGNFSVGVSGNVTLKAVGNVTAYVPNTVGLGAGYELISGAIVNVSDDIHNALEEGNGTVTIKLCVNDSVLNAKGLTRSNVQIYVYDEDAGKLVGLPTTRVTGTDCHTADISGYLSEVIVGIAGKPPEEAYRPSRGGGGGGVGTYPPGWGTTPAVTATAAHGATPGATAAPSGKYVTPTPKKPVTAGTAATAAEGATAGAAAKKKTPGFEAVFAIAGLLAIAYVLMRRRE